MPNPSDIKQSPANALCKSCGLCCTGHLFAWTKLRSAELDSIQSLGLTVFREPERRGFSQPCPLWDGVCTVYMSPQYPRFCATYKCKLLKELINEDLPLADALTVVREARELIDEVESLLPDSPNPNFRERLIAHLEQGKSSREFQLKAKELLSFYETRFGVDDLIEMGDK